MGTSMAPAPKPSLSPSAIAWVTMAVLGEASATIMESASTMMATPTRSLAVPDCAGVWGRRACRFAFLLRLAGIWC